MNNQLFSFASTTTLEQAVKHYGLIGKVFAVAVNGQLVPKTQHEQILLEENMLIDIIVPMQGG